MRKKRALSILYQHHPMLCLMIIGDIVILHQDEWHQVMLDGINLHLSNCIIEQAVAEQRDEGLHYQVQHDNDMLM
jgi:hypothetical protein